MVVSNSLVAVHTLAFYQNSLIDYEFENCIATPPEGSYIIMLPIDTCLWFHDIGIEPNIIITFGGIVRNSENQALFLTVAVMLSVYFSGVSEIHVDKAPPDLEKMPQQFLIQQKCLIFGCMEFSKTQRN